MHAMLNWSYNLWLKSLVFFTGYIGLWYMLCPVSMVRALEGGSICVSFQPSNAFDGGLCRIILTKWIHHHRKVNWYQINFAIFYLKVLYMCRCLIYYGLCVCIIVQSNRSCVDCVRIVHVIMGEKQRNKESGEWDCACKRSYQMWFNTYFKWEEGNKCCSC